MDKANIERVFRRSTVLLLLFVGAVLAVPASGHLMPAWSYQEMFDKADVVVIAKGRKTQDTAERMSLPGIVPPNPPILMIGMSAEFESLLVLKGDKTHLSNFTVHYYRLPDAPPAIVNGPSLPQFHSDKGGTYLLFLKKEQDGRYVTVTDPTDSALFSVLKLDGLAD